MTGIDFTPPKHVAFSTALQLAVDTAMQERDAAESAKVAADPKYQRPAIGVGGLGNDCLRALGYEYHRVPKDPARAVKPGKLLRIFRRGHNAERDMAEYLRLAGFELVTADERGRQFRFDDAPYEDGKGRIKGMVDGLIRTGPPVLLTTLDPNETAPMFRMTYPLLWENKEVNNKKFNLFMKKGVRDVEIDYFTQAQMLMAHFRLEACLFTAKNADTQEIFAELIQFDARFAQAISDKAVRVISSSNAEELPQIGDGADDFRCKFCDWHDRCWQVGVPAVMAAAPVLGGQALTPLTPPPVPNSGRPAWLTPPAPAQIDATHFLTGGRIPSGYERRQAWLRQPGPPAEPEPSRTLTFTGDRGFRKP